MENKLLMICPDCGSTNMHEVIDGCISCLDCYGIGKRIYNDNFEDVKEGIIKKYVQK